MIQQYMTTTLLARMTRPCKDVAHLASQAMDQPLPWLTRLNLQLHYCVCEACARYRDQLRTVRQVVRRLTNTAGDWNHESSLPAPVVKARLTEAFRAKYE